MRTTINFIIDCIFALVMIALIWTGLVMRYLLPPGTGGRMNLWGWTRHEWGTVHFWIAVAAAVVLIVHVAMHWNWACLFVRKKLGWEGMLSAARLWISGVIFGLVMAAGIGGTVWMASGQIEERSRSSQDSEQIEHREDRGWGRGWRR